MLENLLQAYITVLKIHIGTKTKDKVFHEFSADVYDWLFDVFHRISEKLEDIERWEYTENDLQNAKQRLYNTIETIKMDIESTKDLYSTWYNNLVCELTDNLESLCGTARWFIVEPISDSETEDLNDDENDELTLYPKISATSFKNRFKSI